MTHRPGRVSVCAEDGCDTITDAGRCSVHQVEYSAQERRRMAAAVASHVRVYGHVCFGDGEHDPHETTDLTADHVIPLAQGGEGGPLVVRCRSSNSRDGARL